MSGVTFPLFELLPEHERQRELSKLKIQKYCAGRVIYERGGDCTDAFFIFEGRVKIDTSRAGGETAFYHYRKPGGMIGYYAAITGKLQTVTATAAEDTVLGRLNATEFMELVLSSRELSAYMLRFVTGILRSETNRIRHLILLDAPSRVAAELLEYVAESGSHLVEIPERDALASRLGMTRETLARHLSELQRRRLIAIKKQKIHIRDLKQLSELVG